MSLPKTKPEGLDGGGTMTCLHDPAEDILPPIIRRLGFDPKFFGEATDINFVGHDSPLMIWTTSRHRNDGGLLRLIANKIAEQYDLTTSSKKGANQRIGFVHRFEPGRRDLTDEEVGEVLNRLTAAKEEFEARVEAVATWAVNTLGSSELVG